MRNNRISLLVAAAALATCLSPAKSQAATATSAIAVSATVLSFCTITAAPLIFGNYTSVTLDGTTTVTVVCTLSTPYQVTLNAGTGTGATVAVRKLTNGAVTLNYSLYSDAARATVWGATIGTDSVGGTGTGLTQALTVYGRIPAGQFPTPGAYSDVVTATITY